MGIDIIMSSFPGWPENDSRKGVPTLLFFFFYRCLMFNYIRFGFGANMAGQATRSNNENNEIAVYQPCLFKRTLRRILLQCFIE